MREAGKDVTSRATGYLIRSRRPHFFSFSSFIFFSRNNFSVSSSLVLAIEASLLSCPLLTAPVIVSALLFLPAHPCAVRSPFVAHRTSFVFSLAPRHDREHTEGTHFQTSYYASARSSLRARHPLLVHSLVPRNYRENTDETHSQLLLRFYTLIAPLLPLHGRPQNYKGKRIVHPDFLLCLSTLLARLLDCSGKTNESFSQATLLLSCHSLVDPKLQRENKRTAHPVFQLCLSTLLARLSDYSGIRNESFSQTTRLHVHRSSLATPRSIQN
jgi:hypothetical protein